MFKRLLGPLLIVALGTAFLFGLGQTPADAGTTTPCTTIPGTGNADTCTPPTTCPPVAQVGNVNPCVPPVTTDPCGPSLQGVVNPCQTTAAPTTTAPGSTTSVLGGTVNRTPTTAKTRVAPATSNRNGGKLARTGSSNGPLTALGAGLVLFGFGLLVTSTRIHRRRIQA